MYCEHCGLQILPQRPVCTRCGFTPTQQWFQLTSLFALALAVACNSAVGWFVLPHLAANHPHLSLFHLWFWVDEKGALYGWMPLAAALLAWDYFVWRKVRKSKAQQKVSKIRGWITRRLLTFSLAAAVAPILPWWIPAGQPSDKVLAALASHPGLPAALSWGIVLVVAALLCARAETRDLLLGRGKVLSFVSLSVLAAIISLTILGWSLT